MKTTSEALDSWSYARSAPGQNATDFAFIGAARCVGRIMADTGHDPIEHLGGDDLDSFDHHYRIEFPPRQVPAGARVTLHLPVVATIATIAWDGEVIGTSDNSFVPVALDVTDLVTRGGTLSICCHSLTHWLGSEKRARPRFRSRLVADQRLRFARASLLGRIPAWSPPAPVVGISGSTELVTEIDIKVDRVAVVARLASGSGGIDARIDLAEIGVITSATLLCHGHSAEMTIDRSGPRPVVTGHLQVPDVRPWWPHTHGDPVLYGVSACFVLADGRSISHDLGRTGFRSLTIDRGVENDRFAIAINEVSVFCRGSAWMPLDPRDPWVSEESLREALVTCRDAGMNMIRLTGVTGWEQPAFYDLCAELGILLWQDLPFATLDQPTDVEFLRTLRSEVRDTISAVSFSPALVVLCGASERQQQAAMLGLDREVVVDAAAGHVLADALAEIDLDVAYVECSPSGGHLPFVADRGVSHYYGVGAYLRPLIDARHANVRFTSECLAFSNVPEPATIDRFLDDGETAPTHPRWKQRVPRDRGVGWDFEDVRDHYLGVVTGEDPFALRQRDVDRYLELSRVVSGLVMTSAFQEWRRPTSTCAGALTWFLRDLWRGAGWGLIDADGRAKAAFGSLADTWAPVSMGLIDEGVNGVDVWIHNDRPEPVAGMIELIRIRDAKAIATDRTATVSVKAHSSLHLRADELVGRFTDPSDAYRFGPRDHDGLAARLVSVDGATLARHVLDTSGGQTLRRTTPEWDATATVTDPGRITVSVNAVDLLRDVRIEDPGLAVDRHHVDVVPGEHREFRVRHDGRVPSAITVGAVNARATRRVPVRAPA